MEVYIYIYKYDVYIRTLPRLQEIADGNSFSVPCVNYLAGWDGNAGVSEPGGSDGSAASAKDVMRINPPWRHWINSMVNRSLKMVYRG